MLKQNNILNFLNRFTLLYNSDISYNAAPEAVCGDVLIHVLMLSAMHIMFNDVYCRVCDAICRVCWRCMPCVWPSD